METYIGCLDSRGYVGSTLGTTTKCAVEKGDGFRRKERQ